ncbi:FlgB family protein [Litoreibacter sp.]|nr:FlgB family protein [Litoreibacter sp.]
MLKSLEIFQSAQNMARHAAAQQGVVAKNMAHADTPGFKAMTLPELEHRGSSMPMNMTMRAPRPQHILSIANSGNVAPITDPNADISPNGNSVSVETETLKSIEAERAHSRALTVYQSALNILRTSIGRGR